eukprot:2099323-Rhodomonas_salina.1
MELENLARTVRAPDLRVAGVQIETLQRHRHVFVYDASRDPPRDRQVISATSLRPPTACPILT